MMNKMKYLLLVCITAICQRSFSQAAFVLPSPTGADEMIKLFIDVQQTSGGLKTILNNHPEVQDSGVYIWTWMPHEPTVTNGSWNLSPDTLRMKHEGNLLYSISFVPTDFYGVDGPTFFTNGISCLAKLQDGNAFGDDAVGEAKTEDLHVTIIPKLCDDIYCEFPQAGKPEDFFSVTYDNNQETQPEMMDLGDDEVYLFIRAHWSNLSGVNYAEAALTASTPELKMKPVPGQPGFFRLTIIPDEFFEGLIPVGSEIIKLRFYALTPGFTYSGVPPFDEYFFSDCSE